MKRAPQHVHRCGRGSRRPAVSYSAAGAVGAHDRTTVAAIPFADAPPKMQRAIRLLRLLQLLDPALADQVIDIDERDVDDFYGTG
jgi:hypothetical protein